VEVGVAARRLRRRFLLAVCEVGVGRGRRRGGSSLGIGAGSRMEILLWLLGDWGVAVRDGIGVGVAGSGSGSGPGSAVAVAVGRVVVEISFGAIKDLQALAVSVP